MVYTNGNVPLLHRKEWQMMSPAPLASLAGAFFANSPNELQNKAVYVAGYSSIWVYHADEDAFLQLPNSGLAGTFGAGAAAVLVRWSPAYTANGGSTTTVTVPLNTHNICGYARGETIEFLTGTAANLGQRRTISEITNSGIAGSTITLTLSSAVPSAVVNTDTFRISSGSLFTVGAGTLAAGSFKQFDFATNSWGGNLSIVNLPATLATDGRMAYPYVLDNPFATGTATAGGATTLTNGLKAWTTNQWTNYQVRITGGTGIGQVRTIASNTGTVLTVSASWTTNPDVTSTYEIEGNQDHIYYLGNNAVAMYRYTISTNAWALLAPGVARAAAPGLGMSACIPLNIDRAGWDTENTISNGKFIYSYRGGASGVLDRYDIAANSWSAVTTINTETFTTGSSYDLSDRYIYIRKDATNRFFKMSITGNYIEPLSTDFFPDGAALIGNKMWVQTLPNSTNSVKWLYSLQNTGTVLRRLPLYQD